LHDGGVLLGFAFGLVTAGDAELLAVVWLSLRFSLAAAVSRKLSLAIGHLPRFHSFRASGHCARDRGRVNGSPAQPRRAG
jgi:hypothetical protein